jgi:hypothetical protein
MASLEPHCFPALVFNSKVNTHIKIIHVITRLDMGGSAQNTLTTALNHDSQHYNVWLIKGSTLESAMTKGRSTGDRQETGHRDHRCS